MEIEQIYNKISDILAKKGFKKIYVESYTPYFKWVFDIFAESKKEALIIEYRKNERISDVFLENVSSIDKFPKKLYIYIIFERKPSKSIIDMLYKKGIGVMIFQNNKLFQIQGSKDFSKKRIKKKKAKKEDKPMHQFFVYPSSLQNETLKEVPCKERSIICNIVSDFNRQNNIPIHIKLPENDKRFGKDFNKCMRVNINESIIFIGVLKEEYSKNVEYEIHHAFRNIKDKKLDKRLTLFLKKTVPWPKFDGGQQKLIKYVEKNEKHLPYSNLAEFKYKVVSNLMAMINLVYHKNKRKSPLEMIP